jgi:hypothetical protein
VSVERSEIYMVMSRGLADLDFHALGDDLEESLEAAKGLSETIPGRKFFVVQGSIKAQYWQGGELSEEAVLA